MLIRVREDNEPLTSCWRISFVIKSEAFEIVEVIIIYTKEREKLIHPVNFFSAICLLFRKIFYFCHAGNFGKLRLPWMIFVLFEEN